MQLLASEEYGLRCLMRVVEAGACGGGPVPITRIARDEGLSPEYTAKLMRQLRLGGIVTSVRGADGGYRLARAAREITVWNAMESLGGEFFPESFCACHPGQPRECVRSADCSLRALWRTVQKSLRETLEGITLEDLRRNEPNMVAWLEPSTATGTVRA